MQPDHTFSRSMGSNHRGHAVRWLWASTLAVVCQAVQADPGQVSDDMTRLLMDRGVVQPNAEIDDPLALPGHEADSDAGFTHKIRAGASSMVITAMNFLGVPYRRGGNDETSGFDCSGFTRYIFERSLGLVLPRRVDEQASAPGLIAVKREELKPGDLVFFNTLKRTFSHVGIYVGDGKFIHAPRTGAVVRVEDMRFDYWRKRFTGARRAAQPPAPVAPAEPDLQPG